MLISDANCDRLIALVAHRTGLNIHGRDVDSFRQIVQQRVDQLNLPSVETYYQQLSLAGAGGLGDGLGTGDRSASEWQVLLSRLTVGESYFFRDHRQLSLLRNQIIPDLLHQRQTQLSSATSGSQPLRLWSAGCATGEEAYSLAILVQDLGQQGKSITPEVVGTDINVDFLAKARQGLYGEWSFRQTQEILRQRYFQPQRGKHWQINPDLKRHTNFLEFNLVQDDIAHLVSAGDHFDLILCRNVFIYFTPEAIAQTLTTFYRALKPGGYLVTGHAELQGIPLSGLQVRCFPESIVYQRPVRSRHLPAGVPTLRQAGSLIPDTLVPDAFVPDASGPNAAIPNASGPNASRPRQPVRSRHLPAGVPTLRQVGYLPPDVSVPNASVPNASVPNASVPNASVPNASVPNASVPNTSVPNASAPKQPSPNANVTPLPPKDSPPLPPMIQPQSRLYVPQSQRSAVSDTAKQQFVGTMQRAKQYANTGHYERARHLCQEAIALQPLAVEPCYLLASIAEETGDWDEAKGFLKRVIYLDTMAIPAYLELAALYDRTREGDRATKTRRSIISLLAKMPPHTILPTCDNMTVTELQTLLSQQMSKRNP